MQVHLGMVHMIRRGFEECTGLTTNPKNIKCERPHQTAHKIFSFQYKKPEALMTETLLNPLHTA